MMKFQTRVVFHERMRCFYDTERKCRMKGIVELLGDTFYPKYKYLKSKKSADDKSPPPTTEKQKQQKGLPVKKKFPIKKWAGRRRGSRVDKEIAYIINGGFIANPHEYTERALNALQACNLRPVKAQVVVYHAEAKLASAIDIFCQDVDGAYAVVELKCSSDSKYTHSCFPMKGVMGGHCDSLLEQHALQAAVTTRLFENTYGSAVKLRTYVLRVNDEGAHVTRIRQLDEYREAFDVLIKKCLKQIERKAKALSNQKDKIIKPPRPSSLGQKSSR